MKAVISIFVKKGRFSAAVWGGINNYNSNECAGMEILDFSIAEKNVHNRY